MEKLINNLYMRRTGLPLKTSLNNVIDGSINGTCEHGKSHHIACIFNRRFKCP